MLFMKSQIFITLDSLRWDVFASTPNLFIKKFTYSKAWTHATYTQAAHMAFFTGRLPCSYCGKFDTCARSHRKISGIPQWRLNNPECPGPGKYQLSGKNIIDGFKRLNYLTIGTGGVNWFNNNLPAHIPCLDDFEKYKWFGNYIYGPDQIDWILKNIDKQRNNFIFINFGETHHPYITKKKQNKTNYGSHGLCFYAQQQCLIYLDKLIEEFFDNLNIRSEFIICGDHGECMGENDLWGHGFYHEKIMEVPIIKGELNE